MSLLEKTQFMLVYRNFVTLAMTSFIIQRLRLNVREIKCLLKKFKGTVFTPDSYF